MGTNKKVHETKTRHVVRRKIVIPHEHTEEDKSEHVIIHFHKKLRVHGGKFWTHTSRIKEKLTIKRHFNMIGYNNSSRRYDGGFYDKTKDLIEKHMLKE